MLLNNFPQASLASNNRTYFHSILCALPEGTEQWRVIVGVVGGAAERLGNMVGEGIDLIESKMDKK